MKLLISNVFQALEHIQEGSGPHLTLSRAGLNVDVWIKGENWKMEIPKFEFFGWLEFFLIFLR